MKPLQSNRISSNLEIDLNKTQGNDFLEGLYKNLKEKIKANISKTINDFFNNAEEKDMLEEFCEKNKIFVDVNIYFSKQEKKKQENFQLFENKIDIQKIVIPKFEHTKSPLLTPPSLPEKKKTNFNINKNQILYENYLKKQSCSIFKNTSFEKFDPVLEQKRLDEKVLSTQCKKIKSFWKNSNYTYPYTFKQKFFESKQNFLTEIYDISNKFIRND